MRFTLISDERRLLTGLGLLNTYASRWAPHTKFTVEIKRQVKKKIASHQQRGYYFAEVLPKLMRGCGYDPDEAMLVHRQLKIIFFQVQPDRHGIYRNKRIPSVFSLDSDIGTKKRNEFIEWVMRKAAENGEYVHSPTG